MKSHAVEADRTVDFGAIESRAFAMDLIRIHRSAVSGQELCYTPEESLRMLKREENDD